MTTRSPYWQSCFSGKQAREMPTCLSCPLPDCAGRDDPRCPLRVAELAAKAKAARAERVVDEFTMARIVGKAMRRM